MRWLPVALGGLLALALLIGFGLPALAIVNYPLAAELTSYLELGPAGGRCRHGMAFSYDPRVPAQLRLWDRPFFSEWPEDAVRRQLVAHHLGGRAFTIERIEAFDPANAPFTAKAWVRQGSTLQSYGLYARNYSRVVLVTPTGDYNLCAAGFGDWVIVPIPGASTRIPVR